MIFIIAEITPVMENVATATLNNNIQHRRIKMGPKRILTAYSIFLAIAITGISAGAAEHSHDSANHMHNAPDKNQKAVEFTLKEVMQDLAASIDRINSGILTNNRLMIMEGAHGIAHHPNPKGGLDPYIKKNADIVKKVAPEMDKQVHDTALEVANSATTATMKELQTKSAKILRGCVGCHDVFRD